MSIKNFYFYIIICLSIISNCFADSNDLPYVEGEILIRFAQKAPNIQRSINECNQILASLNAGEVKRSYNIVPGLTLVKLPEGLKVNEALTKFEGNSEILHIQPNYKYEFATMPNDTEFLNGNLWGMHNTGQTIQYYAGRPDADIDAVQKP